MVTSARSNKNMQRATPTAKPLWSTCITNISLNISFYVSRITSWVGYIRSECYLTLQAGFLFFITFQKTRGLSTIISEHQLFQQEKFKEVGSFIAYWFLPALRFSFRPRKITERASIHSSYRRYQLFLQLKRMHKKDWQSKQGSASGVHVLLRIPILNSIPLCSCWLPHLHLPQVKVTNQCADWKLSYNQCCLSPLYK